MVSKRSKKNVRYIFVSGGVMSSLGKGITAASLSLLLQKSGYSVCPIKCENNLNVDFGTLNPIEHGDPFLCADGLEADLDLGNYERFLGVRVGHPNFMTMGQLYKTVIEKERCMGYDGEDVEPIPHVVEEIMSRFRSAGEESGADFVVIELGGTVGEYQNNNALYYEASRVMGFTEDVVNIHVTYVPVPPHVGEPKTKPAQFGIRDLMSMGIAPDLVVVRSELPLDDHRRFKLSQKINLQSEDVFSNENIDTIYNVPVHLEEQGFTKVLLNKFGIKQKKSPDLAEWKKLVKKIQKEKKNKITLAIVGKYFAAGDSHLRDVYYALFEAIDHAGWAKDTDVEIKMVNSEKEEKKMAEALKGVDAIIVPIGWGVRGMEGKIAAIKYAREKRVPYLGLCYGMQLAAVEYARHVAGLTDAHTEECKENAAHRVIHSIPFNEEYQTIKGTGTSMRLGTFDCVLKEGTHSFEIYKKYGGFKNEKKGVIEERHRHRFEFNNEYRERLQKDGFVISGTSPDDFFVEMIELPKKVHPYFIATQGHPEYKSRPTSPHPVFLGLLDAANKYKKIR